MISPFDDFRNLSESFLQPDDFDLVMLGKSIEDLKIPKGAFSTKFDSLGQVKDWLIFLAKWRGFENIAIAKPSLALFASTQDILSETTNVNIKNIVKNIHTGCAMVNGICLSQNIALRLYDLAIDYPTMNILEDDAMDERTAAATMAFGLEAIANGVDFLGIASVGADQQISEDAIAAFLFGEDFFSNEPAEKMQLLKDILRQRKISTAIENEIDCFEIVRRIGSRDLAAIMGAILSTRIEKIPVLLSGYSAVLAACLLKHTIPDSVNHCMVVGNRENTKIAKLNDHLQLGTINAFAMEQDNGTSAGLAMGIIKSCANAFTKCQTFEKSELLLAENRKLSS